MTETGEREPALIERQAGVAAGSTEPGPPPIGRSWERLYAVVLAELALLIVLFYWFTKAFE